MREGREREKLRRAIDSRVSLDSILDDWKEKERKKERKEETRTARFCSLSPIYARLVGGWVRGGGGGGKRKMEEKGGKSGGEGGKVQRR